MVLADSTWRVKRCHGILKGMLAVMLIGGCDQEGIRVYEAPKDPPVRQTAEASGASGGTQSDAVAAMHWQAPDDWTVSTRPAPMRLATYYAGEGEAEDAPMEVVVSAFPGDVGGTLANVNRWREQLGLGPITEDELGSLLHAFGESGEVHGYTLRIDPESEAADAQGMLGAIIHSPGHEYTWFIRAFGQLVQLEAHEAQVRAFARTFELADQPLAHDHAHDHSERYAEDNPAFAQQPVEAGSGEYDSPRSAANGTGDALTLEKPTDWREIEPASSIVYASYEVGPPRHSVSIAVTPLAGDAGGLFANVNMWRQQIGLPGLEHEDQQPVEPIDVDGRQGQLVRAEGEVEALVAVVVPDGDRTWFFRMSGPREIVDQQREYFERFVREARFREP